MSRLAIIGGTGAAELIPSQQVTRRDIATPFGQPSSPLFEWRRGDRQLAFLARHGPDGSIPPHRVNYQANIWALSQLEPDEVVGINAVGAIAGTSRPGQLVIPDQLIDYTWGRAHSYADGIDRPLQHAEFTAPFSDHLRVRLIDCARSLGLQCTEAGTYAVMQGPRLETSAEIDRLERDGCDIVGMTAMPEAALARELELDYAICAVVVNQAAGRAPPGAAIHDEIEHYLHQGMQQVGHLLDAL